MKESKQITEDIAKIGEEKYKILVRELDKMKPDEGRKKFSKVLKA